ncbi:MAG: lipoyl synthase [Candidatus Symbiodolus clandestinus]
MSKQPGIKYRDADKIGRIAIKNLPLTEADALPKPPWMKIKLPVDSQRIQQIKAALRRFDLHSVCEEAACPNLSECFNHGTATFMILGAICTRRCPFCDVAHGRPLPPDQQEPQHLAAAIREMQLRYVVITSVDRDDLPDGGAQHFVDCIQAIRSNNPTIVIEILVPDFRGRLELALTILSDNPPDIFNHNIESIPRLYRQVRPGANYRHSLKLLQRFQQLNPDVPTKSGLMVGLGETKEEIIQVMHDLRQHQVSRLTIGQYLQPSRHHLPVARYVAPEEFSQFKQTAYELQFTHAACGPLVRSSYHADQQAQGIEVT